LLFCLIEKATQIKADYPAATAIGGQNRVTREPVPTDYRLQKPEIRFTCILNKPEAPQTLLVVKGKAVKRKPSNRTGKKIYTHEVIASLRLIWAFFRYTCGKLLAPLIRWQMPFNPAMAGFRYYSRRQGHPPIPLLPREGVP
jgi:hypothetical protein